MAKYISNRQQNLKIGINSYTENKTVLEVTGKVGIGTTNATSKLYVVGDGYFTGVVTATSFRGDGSLLTGITGGVSISTNTTNQNQYINYATSFGSTTGLGVTTLLVYNPSSGNLGIGTTNPTSKLTVGGDVLVSGVSTISVNSSNSALRITQLGSGNAILVEDSTNPDATPFVVTNTGDIGIGTLTPTTKLSIDGTISFSDSNIKLGTPGTGLYSQFNPNTRGIFIGEDSGFSNTTGLDNIFLGYVAGYSNITGYVNIFIGSGAGYFNDSGYNNNFIGYSAGYSNFNGNENNFFGNGAGYANTSGSNNQFIGQSCGNGNTSGSNDIFIGQQAGTYNQTGNYDIYLGSWSGLSTSKSYKVILGSGNISGIFDSPDTTKDYQFAVGIRTDANPSKYWLVGNENFNVGIGTTNPTSKLYVVGDTYVTGVVTASSFSGNASSATYATSSGIATNLTSTSSVNTTGIITATSFTGSGANLTNLNASNLSSGIVPAARITETSALNIGGDLYVSGNISFGGTTTQLNTSQLTFSDPDLVLGVGTTSTFNPTDNTANHGGIAIASTEGSPLVNLNIAPAEVLPTTYKKFMWFKNNTAGLGTDAWLSNYAIGIGSTQFPTGTRLAVGDIQFTQNDLSIVRNINASGVVTALSFSGNASSATYATSSGIATYASTAGIATYATSSGIATYATSSGIATYATSSGIATYASTAGIATYATSSGIATSVLINPGVGISTAGGTVGTGATILDFRGSGISTVTVSAGIATINIIGTTIAITDDIATNATYYVGIANTTTGNLSTLNVSSSKLTFNPSTGNLVAGGTVTANSDEKLKTNIKTIDNALEKVLSLRGVEYDRIDTQEHQIGVIAQEVEKIIPEVVYPKQPAPDYETKSVAYANLVGLLIEAIKEQNQRIIKLERRLEGT